VIELLRSSAEIESACGALSGKGLPLHRSREKNWDHSVLTRLLASLDPGIEILDCGAGAGLTLGFLHTLGYRKIRGIDLAAPRAKLMDRLKWFFYRDFFQAALFLEEGDICSTRFADETFDLLVSVSVLEHDVDIDEFLKESARILKSGGVLFTSFDYWEATEEFEADGRKICGLPWHILNKESVEGLLKTAEGCGLELFEPSPIPDCHERVVTYGDRSYTFMAIVLKKQHPASG